MKKVLMGTTALVAAGAAVAGGVAQAQEEPISLGLGGYYRAAIGVVDQDSDIGELGFGTPTNNFAQDIEINVSGSTTLDNGLVVGAQMLIEGNAADNASSSLDERFVFFRGSFGQIRFGSTESARQELVNFAPSGAYNFGVNTPFFKFWSPNAFAGFGAGGADDLITTYNDDLGNEDSLKVVYFSPVFNGFRVAVSYSPDDTDFAQYGGATNQGTLGLQDHLGVGAEYSNNFGDFGVRVSGGYEQYVLENCSTGGTAPLVAQQGCENSPSSWNAGGTVSFGGFSIGGGYHEHDGIARDVNGNTPESQTLDVGIAYWSGPFGVGVQYGSADYEQVTGFTTEIEQIALNGTYILGPGIDLEAQIDFGEFDLNNGTATGDNDWVSFLFGTALTF